MAGPDGPPTTALNRKACTGSWTY